MHPSPIRLLAGRVLAAFLPYETQVEIYAAVRPHYAYCTLKAAQLAARLRVPRISAIEFGVSGGNGLVNLEHHAAKASAATGVAIDVFGFDTGAGLPAPTDYRDAPHAWRPGFYVMDQAKLRSRLKSAKLVIGDIKETAGNFVEQFDPAPIGCMFHDTDYYSSTVASFALLDIPPARRLPRIFNYFDDVIGDELELFNEFTGELLAIAEYNQAHGRQKLAKARQFAKDFHQTWHDQIYIHHDFDHPLYGSYVSDADKQSKLRA